MCARARSAYNWIQLLYYALIASSTLLPENPNAVLAIIPKWNAKCVSQFCVRKVWQHLRVRSSKRYNTLSQFKSRMRIYITEFLERRRRVDAAWRLSAARQRSLSACAREKIGENTRHCPFSVCSFFRRGAMRREAVKILRWRSNLQRRSRL